MTGRLPFVADDPSDYLQQIVSREPRPPRTIDDRIPEELERMQRTNGDVCSRRTTWHFNPATPETRQAREYFPDVCLERALTINTLTLRVAQGRMERLGWNGQTLQDFDPAIADDSDGSDVVGAFGVFADQSVAVFSSVRINGVLQEFRSTR